MRLTYDYLGSGRVTGQGHPADIDAPYCVEFLDAASLPTMDRILRSVAAGNGRFTVKGASGARQLLDRGVSIASEFMEGAATIATVTGLQPALDAKQDVIPSGTFAQALIPTAVKTAPYTAVPKDYVLVDATAGTVAITLPSAPADGSRIGIKLVATASTNVATFASGGSDHLNLTTGPTSGTVTLLNQAVILQYASSNAVWTVQSSDLPLGQLDTRFQPAFPAGTYAKPATPGTLASRPAATVVGQRFLASDTASGTEYESLDGSTWTQMAPGIDDPLVAALIFGGI